jgi:hypothetical protein
MRSNKPRWRSRHGYLDVIYDNSQIQESTEWATISLEKNVFLHVSTVGSSLLFPVTTFSAPDADSSSTPGAFLLSDCWITQVVIIHDPPQSCVVDCLVESIDLALLILCKKGTPAASDEHHAYFHENQQNEKTTSQVAVSHLCPLFHQIPYPFLI